MDITAQYRSEKNQYLNLLRKVRDVVASINNFTTNTQDEVNILSNSYNVNNEDTEALTRLKKVKSDAQKTSNYLKNTVIPSIESNISSLERTIDRLEEEERERQLNEANKSRHYENARNIKPNTSHRERL